MPSPSDSESTGCVWVPRAPGAWGGRRRPSSRRAGKFSVCRASEGKEKGEGAGDAAGEGGRLSSGEGLRDSTGPGRSLGPLSRSLQASRSPRPRTGHAQATPAPHGQGGLACLSPLPRLPLPFAATSERLLLPSCRAVSPPPTLLVPYFPCSPSLSPADFCAPGGSGGCVSCGQRGPDPSEGAGGWRANERPRGGRERVRRRKPQISSALSHAGWELDPWPPGWGAHLALPGELDAEPSTRAAGGHWRPPYCTKGREGVVSRTSCQSRVEPASHSGPVRKAGAVVAVCQPTGLVPSGWVGLLARHA